VPHHRAAAVVRFSSLGDVLLAAHVPGFLKQEDPARRVLFVTKGRYVNLLHGHPHVDRMYALREREANPADPAAAVLGSLGDLISGLRRDGVVEILDLHQNWRSARIRSAFAGAKHRLPPKYALRRRLWVYARWLHPAPVPPLLRTYQELAGVDPGGTDPVPWLRSALSDPELERGAERAKERSRGGPFIVIGAGARWETKRWPAAHFVELARRIERERGWASLFAVAPGEPGQDEIASYLAARGETPLSLPFRELAGVAAHARGIVSNDSGVLHLGAALGIPAVGVFGSTVPEFGFARQGPRDQVAEIRLGCRPCGVHGRRRCPLGHHACMKRLDPDLVIRALARALDEPTLSEHGAPAAASRA
jgi:heptosyltransferase-2